MKKLTLLGDSIRQIGYGKRVPELLREEFQVYQPEDNCRFAKYTLRGVLYDWAPDIAGSDVIHWNNGLWDICDLGDGVFTSPEEYEATMTRIAARLKTQAKTVIFATTTPVRPGHPYNDNSTIAAYNARIVPVLREMGVIINDLHALVLPRVEEFIREDDKIHLTDAGICACAEQTARIIKESTHS